MVVGVAAVVFLYHIHRPQFGKVKMYSKRIDLPNGVVKKEKRRKKTLGEGGKALHISLGIILMDDEKTII